MLATFVVDTAGRVLPGSYRVLRSDHDLFTRAVREALPDLQFTPAMVGEHRVRQLVKQQFDFRLSR